MLFNRYIVSDNKAYKVVSFSSDTREYTVSAVYNIADGMRIGSGREYSEPYPKISGYDVSVLDTYAFLFRTQGFSTEFRHNPEMRLDITTQPVVFEIATPRHSTRYHFVPIRYDTDREGLVGVLVSPVFGIIVERVPLAAIYTISGLFTSNARIRVKRVCEMSEDYQSLVEEARSRVSSPDASVRPYRIARLGTSPVRIYEQLTAELANTLTIREPYNTLDISTEEGGEEMPRIRTPEEQMRYGFELEFLSENYSLGDIRNIMRNNKMETVLDTSTTSEYHEQWKVTMDSSVGSPERNYDEDEEDYGVEIVSPVFNSWEEMVTASEKLFEVIDQTDGLHFDDKCGLHFHISHPRLHSTRSTELARLTTLVGGLEYDIYRRQKYQARMNRKYCRPLASTILLKACTTVTRNEYLADRCESFATDLSKTYLNVTSSQVREKYGYDNRYRGLNFHALWYRGAIEFRYNEMTFKHEDFLKWFSFYRQAVIYATDQTMQLDTAYMLLNEQLSEIAIPKRKIGVAGKVTANAQANKIIVDNVLLAINSAVNGIQLI